MDAEAWKLVGSGGIAAALLALIYTVGMKMVAAIDRIGLKVDEHTTADLEHHASVKTEIVGLRERLDGILDAQDRAERRLTPAIGIVRNPTER